MSLTVLGSNGGGGYNLESSLRFRSTASAYLSRTPTSAGNRKTWTWSAWVKRGSLDSSFQSLFSADAGGSRIYLLFDTDNSLRLDGNAVIIFDTTAVYRDTSAWYHIVLAVDTTQATASNRFKLYINGSQITFFATDGRSSIAQNTDLLVNNTTIHNIGRDTNTSSRYFDGYMTEVNFVDGQALAPTEFGEYDEDTGVWKPKEYTGTYGTNGFYLENCRGTDQSGNGNDYTENNFNTTSTSVNYDIMNDVPTLTDEDTANFPTYNILFPLSTSTVDNGNIRLVNSGTSAWRHAISSIALPNTGKWYFEMAASVDSNNGHMGLAPVESLANGSNGYVTDAILTNTPNADGVAAGGLAGSTQTWTGTYNINALEALACAVDMDANKVWFRIGSNWVNAGSGAGDPSAGTNPAVSGGINYNKTYHFITSAYAQNHYVNFGQRPFAYTPPTGFKKLNTYNLPDSMIKDGSQYFDIVLYTGNGGTNAITGVGFSPDFVWYKRRNLAADNNLFDTIRGATKWLSSNKTNAETTISDSLTSFDSDGFTLGADGGSNASGSTFVAWNWRASGSSPVTNTNGTITSTVSANTTSGFSIATFTGNGLTAQTIGHGLSQPTELYIWKRLDAAENWGVETYGIDGTADFLTLNTTNAKADSGTVGEYLSTSTTQYISFAGAGLNSNGGNYVVYSFHSVEGYSKIGSYTGNGSADGPFVYTGFDVKFLLYKNADAAISWVLYDNVRDPNGNPQSYYLFPNSSGAEGTTPDAVDFLSNGFKIRYPNASINVSGQTHIYMAFAENPFKNSLAR